MGPDLPEEALRLEERLARPRWAGVYPGPDFEGRSLPSVGVSAYLRAGGAPEASLLPPLDPTYPKPEGSPGTTVVFLLDGFGWHAFRAHHRAARTQLERRLVEGMVPWTRPLTTVFPSTTSSALLSLSTGVAPGAHGVVGYTEYFPGWGAVLNTLKWNLPWGGARDLAIGRQFRVEDLLPTPSLFRRGVRATALTKEQFEGSAFTRMLYDGAKFEGYVSLSDLSHHLARILTLPAAHRPSMVWVYWDLLDAVGHLNGPREEIMVSEISHVLTALASAAGRMRPEDRQGVHLYLTGDHGQVDVSAAKALAVHEDPELLGLLARPPSGERRAAFLTARPGRREQLERHLAARLPPGWKVIPVHDAIEGGLFGPPPHHPELEARLGDLLALAPAGASLWYRPPGSRVPEERVLKGSHGGLTPDELLVALLSVPFDELARWEA